MKGIRNGPRLLRAGFWLFLVRRHLTESLFTRLYFSPDTEILLPCLTRPTVDR